MKAFQSIINFFKWLFLSKEEKLALKENWGVYEESISGREWLLGRRQNWHVAHESNPDSKPLLEELGFLILGIADNMRYCVEPPEGYRIMQSGGCWNVILNKDDEVILNVFEIQEPWDFRCHVTLPKK